MDKDFEPGYCKECKKHQEEVIVPGRLLMTSSWDYIGFVDFVVKGDSISRLFINSTESTKDDYEKSDIKDQQIRVLKFCETLEFGDCPYCGMPVVVPWHEK